MGFWEQIKTEWPVIRGAPLSAVILITVGCGIGYLAAHWYYDKQIIEKNGEINRYRVALGVDKGGPSALVELNNAELREMALNMVPKVRGLCFSLEMRHDAIPPAPKGNETAEKQYDDRDLALRKEIGQEFDRNLRSDFVNIDNELLRRLGSSADAVIHGPILEDAQSKTPIGMPSFISWPEFEALSLCWYANELEQLAKLLPPDSAKLQ